MNLDEIEKLSKEIDKDLYFRGSIGKFHIQETLLELVERVRKLERVVEAAKLIRNECIHYDEIGHKMLLEFDSLLEEIKRNEINPN